MDNTVRMNPDYPQQRGCWIEKTEDGGARLYDYPTWRDRNEPAALPSYNRNEPLPECRPATADFDTVEAAEKFAKEEHYVRCDMPAALRPKRQQPEKAPRPPSVFDF